MECKYCGDEFITNNRFINHNGEEYCGAICCLYDLISRGIVQVGKNYTFIYGGDVYNGEFEIIAAIGHSEVF